MPEYENTEMVAKIFNIRLRRRRSDNVIKDNVLVCTHCDRESRLEFLTRRNSILEESQQCMVTSISATSWRLPYVIQRR